MNDTQTNKEIFNTSVLLKSETQYDGKIEFDSEDLLLQLFARAPFAHVTISGQKKDDLNEAFLSIESLSLDLKAAEYFVSKIQFIIDKLKG